MASPQVENGYTKIANELFEAMARMRIPARSRQVLDVIIRKTYGFNKRLDAISLSQFHLATGISTPNICRAIRELIVMNLIVKYDKATTTEYRLNKDYSTWKPLSNTTRLSNTTIKVVKDDNNPCQIRQIQKKVSKETSTKETIERFEIFYKAYPNKKNKKLAKRTWEKINPDEALLNNILETLKKAVASVEWAPDKEGKTFIPHPSTWLNAEGWLNEYDRKNSGTPEKSAAEISNIKQHLATQILLLEGAEFKGDTKRIGEIKGLIKDYEKQLEGM